MVCHLTLFTICAFLRALLFRLRAGKKGFKRGRLFREVNLRCWAGNKKRIEIGQVTRQCSAVLRLPWLCGVRRASCCCSNRAARLLTALFASTAQASIASLRVLWLSLLGANHYSVPTTVLGARNHCHDRGLSRCSTCGLDCGLRTESTRQAAVVLVDWRASGL